MPNKIYMLCPLFMLDKHKLPWHHSRMVDVGTNIRVERARRNWTQATLVEQTGLSVSTVSQIEAGKQSPTLETLQRIADAFGVSLAALMANAASASITGAQQKPDGSSSVHENQLTPLPRANGGVSIPSRKQDVKASLPRTLGRSRRKVARSRSNRRAA